jgi:hypothetical protein
MIQKSVDALALGYPDTIEIFFDFVDAKADQILANVDALCQPIVGNMPPGGRQKLRWQGSAMIMRPDDSHSNDETVQFFNAAVPYWEFYMRVPDDRQTERVIDAVLQKEGDLPHTVERAGTLLANPLTDKKCRLQVICHFRNPEILEYLINVVRYILAMERGRELANQWREKAVSGFLPGKGDDQSTPAEPAVNQVASGQARTKPRRGGPVPLSDEEKIKIVREWYAVQGKENQETFCHRKGIGASTLRGYMRDLKAKGKLPPS